MNPYLEPMIYSLETHIEFALKEIEGKAEPPSIPMTLRLLGKVLSGDAYCTSEEISNGIFALQSQK
jgi:hypothetical protein